MVFKLLFKYRFMIKISLSVPSCKILLCIKFCDVNVSMSSPSPWHQLITIIVKMEKLRTMKVIMEQHHRQHLNIIIITIIQPVYHLWIFIHNLFSVRRHPISATKRQRARAKKRSTPLASNIILSLLTRITLFYHYYYYRGNVSQDVNYSIVVSAIFIAAYCRFHCDHQKPIPNR